jgi:hypothetical protein
VSRASALTLALLIAGCVTSQEDRRKWVVEHYPPGQLTHAQLRERMRGEPEQQWDRPDAGWVSDGRAGAGDRALAAESRSGAQVQHVERYLQPDPPFGLYLAWFFFDVDDRYVDADYQWQSD